VPQVGVVEEDIAPLLVQGDLPWDPLEAEGDALDPAEVAAREHAEESVGR
jgi:hypothetical protein